MRIENKHDAPCSADGCNSLYIARKKDWLCAYHLQLEYNKKSTTGQKNWFKSNKKRIRQVSKSMQLKLRIYSGLKKEFMSLPENKFCPVFQNKLATEIHHAKGRIGSLLLNTEFFIAVSSEGHKYIHEHDSWSRKNGFIKNRIT